MESNQEHKINKYFFLAIIAIFAFFLLFSLVEFFTAFLGAVMFYVLSKPLMEWLTKRWNWKKSVAASFVIFISFLIVLLPLLFIGSMLFKEASTLASNPNAIVQPLKELNAAIQLKFNINLFTNSFPFQIIKLPPSV